MHYFKVTTTKGSLSIHFSPRQALLWVLVLSKWHFPQRMAETVSVRLETFRRSPLQLLALWFQWLSSIKFRTSLIYKFLDQQGVPRWSKENESVKLTVNVPFKFPLSSHPAVLAWGESRMTNFSSKAGAYISISRDQTNRLNRKLKFRYNPQGEKWTKKQRCGSACFFILDDVSKYW